MQPQLNSVPRKPNGRIERHENHSDSFNAAPEISSMPEQIALIGEWIKTSRENFGLSQRDLSRLSGVAQTYISELENGIAANLDSLPDITTAMVRRAEMLGHAVVTFLARRTA